MDQNAAVLKELFNIACFVRKNGVYPYYLYRLIAAMLFIPSEAFPYEAGFKFEPIKSAVRERSGRNEAGLIYGISKQYEMLLEGRREDPERIQILKRAYEAGFYSEKRCRGCAQGTPNALFEITGVHNADLFRAASGFSGGMALSGDGVCGGYSGGLMFLGYLKGRDLDRIAINGNNKGNQYFANDCTQRLHDEYARCYSSPLCMRIHEKMFEGEHFILRTKARRNEFEEAGAHTLVCTTFVALACVWIAEIMLNMGICPNH